MKIYRIAQSERYEAPISYALKGENGYRLIEDPFKSGKIEETGDVWSAKDARILAPCQPSKILMVDINYEDHALEMKREIGDEPTFYLRPPSSLIGTDEYIIYPRQSQSVICEVELGIVVGKRAKNVMEDEAMQYVFGYTVINSVTAADIQKRDIHWTRCKGFDTFCVAGPAIETELKWEQLEMSGQVNGTTYQQSNTSGMVFKPAQIISAMSKVMTLMPGDLISTGTPAGVQEVLRGDMVEVQIEDIGTLSSRIG